MSERYFPERYFPERYFPGEKEIQETPSLLTRSLPTGGMTRRRFIKMVLLGGGIYVVRAKLLKELKKLLPEEVFQEEVKRTEVVTFTERLPIPWMPKTVLRWSSEIKKVAEEYQVDPNLVAVMVLCESGGAFSAVSGSGAIGLMQVMQYNAPHENLFDPETNIRAGVGYLVRQYQEFGSWENAILAYNAGPGNVRRGTIPPEGKSYLRWVMGMWEETNLRESATYQKWVKAGGSGLLKNAAQVFGNETRLRAIEFATQQWGKPYLWGGEGPDSWDCSGLVCAAYRQAGIEIPRTANEQWQSAGRLLPPEESHLPGDLVFFGERGKADHVGMIVWSPYGTFFEANGQEGCVRVSSLDSRSQIYRGDLAQSVLGFKRMV
ncbi:MAG: transglycosylase SLT domain-containing protein [Microgenomates group bacterium]